MIMQIRTITLFILCVSFLMACGSTPYRDDYAQHVKLQHTQQLNEASLTMALADVDIVETRGLYSQKDEMSGSGIMYDGSAGLAGMLVQIGAHAAMVNSGRDDKLSAQQMQANRNIGLLTDKMAGRSISSLLAANTSFVNAEEADSNTISIKPIFFSNAKMSRLSLKLVASLPNTSPKANLKKSPLRYQNMVHIYSPMPDTNDSHLLDISQAELEQIYSSLLNTALTIVKHDVTGKYNVEGNKTKTFILPQDFRNTVIRGRLADENCEYKIVKNLRNWFIVIPKDKEEVLASANADLGTCQS